MNEYLTRQASAKAVKSFLAKETDMSPLHFAMYDPSLIGQLVENSGGTQEDCSSLDETIAPIVERYLREAREYITMAVTSTVTEYMHQKEFLAERNNNGR